MLSLRGNVPERLQLEKSHREPTLLHNFYGNIQLRKRISLFAFTFAGGGKPLKTWLWPLSLRSNVFFSFLLQSILSEDGSTFLCAHTQNKPTGVWFVRPWDLIVKMKVRLTSSWYSTESTCFARNLLDCSHVSWYWIYSVADPSPPPPPANILQISKGLSEILTIYAVSPPLRSPSVSISNTESAPEWNAPDITATISLVFVLPEGVVVCSGRERL